MPDSLHPPYVETARQQPRLLNRWLDINAQNGPLRRTQAIITIPSIVVDSMWMGYSRIVAAVTYTSSLNFSFKNIKLASKPTYLLCVSFADRYGVHRYAFWKDVGETVYFNLPLYSGQMIKKNFRLEIWDVDVNSTDNWSFTFDSTIVTFDSTTHGF